MKYGGNYLLEETLILVNKILSQHKIPIKWKTTTLILLFKKGNKKDPVNYRGITLLDTMLKVLTKIIANKINLYTTFSEEQQGFRSGRSCTDAIFVMRQIVEKSIEYKKPAYLCFIDIQKAFDCIQLPDILYLLEQRGIPTYIIKTIEDIYSDNKTQARINGQLTDTIPINSGIRQGDSLSPLLFNIIMDEIIKNVKNRKGYKMGNKELKIICYADDAVLLAESEDDLQRLLHVFNTTAKRFNLIISHKKSICMTTSIEPKRCKLELDGKIIQQEMTFKYLGIDLTNYGNVEQEVRKRVIKGNQIAGCLNDTIWKNKHLQIETKTRIYKTAVRPIITYQAETRPDTVKTKRLLETTEMKILRKIVGKTLWDRERSENIRKMCIVEDIKEWVYRRKQEWNAHINRMESNRIVKIARDNLPKGKRLQGRPRKRWYDDLR